MLNYSLVIVNQIITDAKNEDEFITLFNDKLASLLLYYEKNKLGGCNE